MATDDSWKTPHFRQSVVAKIDEAIQVSGMPTTKNSIEMENHVFQKAKSKEEYLGFVARLILHVREMNSKKSATGNAPGTAGTNNQGMPDPIGALQTLARQGTGNNQMMSMGGPNHQGIISQPPTNTATNLLQSLNQRPAQPINMPGIQNKMPGMGMMPSQTGGPMNHLGPIQSMQNNPMLTQMNQMGQGNIPPQMNQMVPGQMGQLGAGQMQQNMQSQMQTQLPGQMNNQITGPIGNIQTSISQQMNQIGPGQLGPGQMQQQLNHIQRKPSEMMNTGFPGPRNVTPNQFLRQSPSPSAPSPAGLGAPSSNQMVASPALVPSPSPQHAIMTGPTRSVNSVGMAPSPSSSLNTPGGVGATPSPQQEDQAYRDKVRQLSKYIEPLRRMIAKMSCEGNVDKLSKMKKLLEILSNPSKRMPLDTLLKCEVVLEKFNFKRGDGSVGPPVTTLKEHQIFSPLLEAVSAHLQSPVINHTLQRTFGPCLDALFGPEIKNLPPPLKKQKIEESSSEIPDVLQGEIARLDQRFKVSLDPAQQSGSRCIQLICWLDDRHLPCVPPISVTVPADYPSTPPRCVMAPHEYEATTFLCAVQKALNIRIAKLPRRFSLSQLLDTWEMSVRQASAPKEMSITASTVLMGL
ncbi:Mediator of RNA polymerase II transcription subunit 15 [Trachymyrmex septentrionalis]|uniref:Mediator of RNA polymerase II transcription subunit 15 n=1 Tax=Trachymyrmex septentrionalis TaxID=34720 RepID=A0A151K197_9HYME|nr:PREDICTED: mediator of RNA polymerase II transcription subunit 15-like [Trachymyrmex septentrionalis]KYN43253.1 Mediator of RNA polymerase II transcription subunit 15 [Trachymyrmex septentrionalis]